jgi:hypothetical protein
MSGCPQTEAPFVLRTFATPREASQTDDPSKDGLRNVTFPLDI